MYTTSQKLIAGFVYVVVFFFFFVLCCVFFFLFCFFVVFSSDKFMRRDFFRARRPRILSTASTICNGLRRPRSISASTCAQLVWPSAHYGSALQAAQHLRRRHFQSRGLRREHGRHQAAMRHHDRCPIIVAPDLPDARYDRPFCLIVLKYRLFPDET